MIQPILHAVYQQVYFRPSGLRRALFTSATCRYALLPLWWMHQLCLALNRGQRQVQHGYGRPRHRAEVAQTLFSAPARSFQQKTSVPAPPIFQTP